MEFQIAAGIISKTAQKPKSKIGTTDMLFLLKQMLDRLNVAYVDECCPDTGSAPLQVNTSTGETEVFSIEEGEWIELKDYVPSGGGTGTGTGTGTG